MRIIVEATTKEIADLVLMLQDQRKTGNTSIDIMSDAFRSAIRDTGAEEQDS